MTELIHLFHQINTNHRICIVESDISSFSELEDGSCRIFTKGCDDPWVVRETFEEVAKTLGLWHGSSK